VDTDRQVAKPAWSPDGQYIAYLTSNWSDRGSDSGDVMIVRPDGGDPKNLTTGAAASYDSLRWSADSSSIIATANVDGGSAVVRISVDTGVIEQLWAGESWLLQLSMSLNGRFAALVSIPETHTEVHSGTLSGDDLPSIRSQAVTRSFPEANSLAGG
jgi:Tol biopolymer transport system component